MNILLSVWTTCPSDRGPMSSVGVARVVQVLTGLSGIAMVGQAHLIPKRSAFTALFT